MFLKQYSIFSIVSFLCFFKSYASVNSKCYHPPGQPPGKFSKIAKSWPRAIFWSNSRGPDFPITFYFNKFYTFSPLSRPQSLIYALNIYKFEVVQVSGPKKWLILGVSLTHLVESRDLLFLEEKIVENIFQWDALKNTCMWQIKSYGDMFQAIRALTVQKILKIRIFSPKLLQNGSCFSFAVKCFDSNYTPRKITFIYIA